MEHALYLERNNEFGMSFGSDAMFSKLFLCLGTVSDIMGTVLRIGSSYEFKLRTGLREGISCNERVTYYAAGFGVMSCLGSLDSGRLRKSSPGYQSPILS